MIMINKGPGAATDQGVEIMVKPKTKEGKFATTQVY